MTLPTPTRLILACWACLAMAGCSSTPEQTAVVEPSDEVCDSYLLMDMCVRDLSGDATVDMVYFADDNEAFMYQNGREDLVADTMPLHRCAVPLNTEMQATTNRILYRDDLSLTEELAITRTLIANYIAAKPSIDACNARYEQQESGVAYDDNFAEDDFDWGE